MQVEQNKQHPPSHPYPILPSHSGTGQQAVAHMGKYLYSVLYFFLHSSYNRSQCNTFFYFISIAKSSLPLPVIIQPDKLVPKKCIILPRYPQEITCPSCQQLVITKMDYRVNASTWLMCCVVFFVGGFLGCCFLPFFMKSCKELAHRCPQCNFIIVRRSLE